MASVVKLKKRGGNVSEEATRKYESSGLTLEDADKLGMYEVENAVTLDACFDGRPAIAIPYFGIDGKPLRTHPTWPDFYRIRYLGADHSFAAATGEKPRRYTQPRDTGVCAYFPPLVDWRAIALDEQDNILFTEGEFKAAKATKDGYPTIGLGGVYNFRSSQAGHLFLPELEEFNWVRRRVVICYDSDYQSNTNVCSAINALAEELQERGALVFVALLPDVYEDDRKTGLDDLLVERGTEALEEVINNAEPLLFTRRLWQMNDEALYVEFPGFIVDQVHNERIPVNAFTGHSRWATDSVPERKVRPDGGMSMVKSAAASAWLKWPLRRSVNKLTYMPGAERYPTEKGKTLFNQWKGWGVDPKKGDISPYLELIKFLFKDAEKAHIDWFLDWCAYPIQFPGTKLFSACLIYGRLTGTGKTLAFYTLKHIYGENFIKIKNENLFETWWYENKQFVLADEISGSDKRSESDALKTIITQEETNINVKYIPQFTIPDVINYGFTSNHGDAMFLEDEDRRYFIHEVMAKQALPEEFYKKYDKWLKDEGGAAALMHWFLQRDLKNFNPKGHAPRTAARERMVMMSKGDIDLWCRELAEKPDTILRFGQMREQRDLFTSKELVDKYLASHPGASTKTANGMARALNRAGFRLVYGGNPIPVAGDQGRYFMIRNPEKWEGVKNAKELAKHIQLGPVRDR